jgi:hypothetical protein
MLIRELDLLRSRTSCLAETDLTLITIRLLSASTFRTHLPPGLSRGYSDSASTVLDDNGAGGYVAHERNESTAHLVSSGAPYGGYPVRLVSLDKAAIGAIAEHTLSRFFVQTRINPTTVPTT